MDINKKVEINTEINNINKILDYVLVGSGLTYKYVEDQIVIIPAIQVGVLLQSVFKSSMHMFI